MGSLGGSSNSTPPKGANLARMELARSVATGDSSRSTSVRMSLTSCSTETPFFRRPHTKALFQGFVKSV